jgi:hypothetical protein
MSDINKLLFHALLLFLMTGSIAGLFAGASLVLRPVWLLYVSRRVNRWVATRQISSLLEWVVKVDRWFYRHHQASGMLLLAGAVFLIYFFIARFDRLRILIGLSRAFAIPPVLTEVLLDSAVLSILLGAAFALIISLFLLIRPSMLRGFEQGANRWISLRRALKPFEISRIGVDEYVFQNVQMAGVLLLFGSLYTLVGLTHWL